jgi:hypothetical protein
MKATNLNNSLGSCVSSLGGWIDACERRVSREVRHRSDAGQLLRRELIPSSNSFVDLRGCIFLFLIALPLLAAAQAQPGNYLLQSYNNAAAQHSFFDKTNLKLQGINVVSETLALLAIQSHDDGGGMARCNHPPCNGALEARGRTLDPFEKHFESYGYGWGSVYRYGGGVGLNMFVAYMFHASGHHKLERWVPVIAIAHAQASTGYALTGSKQGKDGW